METIQIKRIKVYYSYQWKVKGIDNNDTMAAMERIREFLKKSLKEKFMKIDFRRLRATSGNFVFNSIYNKIKDAIILIFDLSSYNPNVMIELGIGLTIQQEIKQEIKQELKIYIIQKEKSKRLPSNIHGYFYTKYSLSHKKIVFKDDNSFLMSLKNTILNLMNQYSLFSNETQIDELNELK